MGQSSVGQFAKELGLPSEMLLEQLKGAGVNKISSEDSLSEGDKTSLLEYLRSKHGAQEPKAKITLTRRQVTEVKRTDSTGKARSISVETRKSRVLVRREPTAPVQMEEIPTETPAAEELTTVQANESELAPPEHVQIAQTEAIETPAKQLEEEPVSPVISAEVLEEAKTEPIATEPADIESVVAELELPKEKSVVETVEKLSPEKLLGTGELRCANRRRVVIPT